MIYYDMRDDSGIETLIDLHDQIIDQDGGYWVKIEAWRVVPTEEIPFNEVDRVLKEVQQK